MTLHLAFNEAYFGHVFPQTGFAKIGQGRSGLWGDQFPLFWSVPILVDLPVQGKRWLAGVFLAGAVCGAWRYFGKIWPYLVFLALYVSFFCRPEHPELSLYDAPISCSSNSSSAWGSGPRASKFGRAGLWNSRPMIGGGAVVCCSA